VTVTECVTTKQHITMTYNRHHGRTREAAVCHES